MTTDDDGRELVATIEKNSLEEVRVQFSEYRGILLVDVRVFADFTGADRGNKKPTKKGISLRVGKLPELIAGLQEAWVLHQERRRPARA